MSITRHLGGCSVCWDLPSCLSRSLSTTWGGEKEKFAMCVKGVSFSRQLVQAGRCAMWVR